MGVFPNKVSQKYVSYAFGYIRAKLSTLCTHPSINKWSKYKPVKHSFIYNRPSDWYKAENGNCGFNIPIYASFEEFINALRSGNGEWAYEHPAGGVTSPYRLGDFAKYSNDAYSQIYLSEVSENYYIRRGSTTTILFRSFITVTSSIEYNLGLTDFKIGESPTDVYYGVCVCNKNTALPQYITDTSDVTSLIPKVDYPTDNLSEGEIEIFQFLTNKPKPTLSGPSPGTVFIPFPKMSRQLSNLIALESIQRQTMMLQWKDGYIIGSIYYVNMSPTIMYVNNSIMYYKYADIPDDLGIAVWEQMQIPAINVPADTTYTYDVNLKALPDFIARGGGKALLKTNGLDDFSTTIRYIEY